MWSHQLILQDVGREEGGEGGGGGMEEGEGGGREEGGGRREGREGKTMSRMPSIL